MSRFSHLFVAAVLCVVGAMGCASTSKYMSVVPDDQASFTPAEDEAMVFFLRPSKVGFAIQSSVFDVTEVESELVGIVSSQTIVPYRTKPGKKLFMVIGENADFMNAELEAGQCYYALVTPRMGVWKARFSLKPVHKDVLGKDDFEQWLSACSYARNTDASHAWAKQNKASVDKKKAKYMVKWKARSVESQPTLRTEDGVEKPF